MEGAALAGHALDEHADGHPTRERVRVDDDIRADPGLAEGHFHLRPQYAHEALLPVPAAEFASDDWITGYPARDRKPLEGARLGLRCHLGLRAQQPHVLDARRTPSLSLYAF